MAIDPARALPLAPQAATANAPAPLPIRPFAIAWGVFWLLLVTVAVQDHLRHGQPDLWRPLLWELSSCLVASALVVLLWHQVPRLDPLLGQPWRWVARPLALLPPAAAAFVAAVYALRHGVYALANQSYRHAPWPEVFAYESVKFAIFYLLFVAVMFGMRSFAAMFAERARAQASLALAREAQLAQLAQQIEPHFLFNALNTVASAIPEQPALAERLLLRLATLLRAATDLARKPEVTLAEELTLLEAYAEIMVQRFADRVQLRWSVDASLHPCPVPALVLQPLLENAFRHGVEQHPGPVLIEIEVARAGAATLRAAVHCSAGELHVAGPATAASLDAGHGVGLANVRRRLALAHGTAASLTLAPRLGGGVSAVLELPCAS